MTVPHRPMIVKAVAPVGTTAFCRLHPTPPRQNKPAGCPGESLLPGNHFIRILPIYANHSFENYAIMAAEKGAVPDEKRPYF